MAGHAAGITRRAARSLLPLVQVAPRALWQRSSQVRLTTATAWLGKPRGKGLTIDDLMVRYLAAFGPASTADVQTWSWLSRLGEVIERLDLMRVKSEGGQTLYDVPDAPRPDPDTPAPVRLVAPFDNILLWHANRTRVISDEHRKRLFSGKNGVIPGTVLVVALRGRVLDKVVSEGNRLLESAFKVTEPQVAFAAEVRRGA
jgi:uncharacterized protein YcaQ